MFNFFNREYLSKSWPRKLNGLRVQTAKLRFSERNTKLI